MADVTGPISTLPGSQRKAPAGQVCDNHPDPPATIRVQGETDSFGSEMIDMCAECHASYLAEIANKDTSGNCDWCKQMSPKLHPKRDFEEGTCGRIYYVCDPCIQRVNAAALEELDAMDSDWSDDWSDDWDDDGCCDGWEDD